MFMCCEMLSSCACVIHVYVLSMCMCYSCVCAIHVYVLFMCVHGRLNIAFYLTGEDEFCII